MGMKPMCVPDVRTLVSEAVYKQWFQREAGLQRGTGKLRHEGAWQATRETKASPMNKTWAL